MKFLPTLHIVVRTVGRGRYAALVNGQEICRSETPFFSAARQLLSQSYDPSTVLAMSHKGSATVAIRSTIGRAAGLTVDEPPQRWHPDCQVEDNRREWSIHGAARPHRGARMPRPRTAKVGPPVG